MGNFVIFCAAYEMESPFSLIFLSFFEEKKQFIDIGGALHGAERKVHESAQILCMTNLDFFPDIKFIFTNFIGQAMGYFVIFCAAYETESHFSLVFLSFFEKKRRFIGIGGAQHGAERKAHERRVGTNSLHDKCGHLCL